ncbi:hypothetical protein LPJ78_002798 [Coemansia sp. RSA 989]|nr:hypothetical protein BX667DRAFT_118622 [Coemansia mojavensis]KAJ1742706.1 hypothetical protein LPJ68_001677 [Coemansia sp. RSA 1086]KAJ1752465.1 hypothetical protein LPJ79_001212 [Coemansia sp. RSA 1821]KAJ1865310.1 hypothetical protein LPJ78_002798 [Coemansia sp. RSA 989]KAJ1874546.1 hypothetical protein LPJ55_001406 [Coemansia sp. RSA 990]KAJ2622294.1 hypothetical protein H4R22_005188 [Coemansia sp. RSA 1290]KAJ2648610.1 hypothetical protein IWW40_003796 [Coemansia sp. RSA 1250]KAJ26733
MTIVIGANFGYTVLAAAGIAIQCFVTGIGVTAARKKYNVQYPDNGGGRFSDKLSDEDWVAFNNIKRVSDNYSEQVGPVLTMLILAGLFQPKLAASLGVVHMIGRFIYGKAYVSKGPGARVYGAPFMGLSFIGMILTAAYNAAMITVFA